MSTVGDAAPRVISFGAAGAIYLGADAELRQGCAAMMAALDRFLAGRFPREGQYERLVIFIDRRAEVIAPIAATSPEGVAAKADAVLRLSGPGIAGYGARIMAASLARDVAREVVA